MEMILGWDDQQAYADVMLAQRVPWYNGTDKNGAI